MAAEKVSKESVSYHYADAGSTGAKHCGNCVMFHPGTNTCDLVEGRISARFVCDKWEAKPGG